MRVLALVVHDDGTTTCVSTAGDSLHRRVSRRLSTAVSPAR
jgi:hypothetical protein